MLCTRMLRPFGSYPRKHAPARTNKHKTGNFFAFDCYPYTMNNPWVLTAFQSASARGPKAGESIGFGRYPDMAFGTHTRTHIHISTHTHTTYTCPHTHTHTHTILMSTHPYSRKMDEIQRHVGHVGHRIHLGSHSGRCRGCCEGATASRGATCYSKGARRYMREGYRNAEALR